MEISRRDALKCVITGVTAGGILLAAPSILTAQSRNPGWFHDFRDHYNTPTRLDEALAGLDSGRAEDYLVSAPAVKGRTLVTIDEVMSGNKLGNHDVLVYANGNKKPVPMTTRDNGKLVIKGLEYPSTLRIFSRSCPEYVESDIEIELLNKKNFVQMSLLERTSNLEAVREIAFSREYGLRNINETPSAVFPVYFTDISLKYREQEKPLEVMLILDEAYDTEFTRGWFENKFRNEVLPGMTRNRLKVKNIKFVPNEEIPLVKDIDPLTVVGIYDGSNWNTGNSPDVEDPKTHLIIKAKFSLEAVEPSFPDKPNIVSAWERPAVQETLQSMGVLGEPGGYFNIENPNSFGSGDSRYYTGPRPTDNDYQAGKAVYSQHPGTKMLGTDKSNFRLNRRIEK